MLQNSMARGKPAEEYWNDREKRDEEFKCEVCNEMFTKDEVVKTDGDILCIECWNEEVVNQEQKHGEKRR